MKNIYSAILIALLINATSDKCMAQWTSVYQDSNALFYDATFPTDNTGYVAASDTGGTVLLRTNDGGTTWNKKYITGWNYIDKMVMTDSISGYLIKGGVPGKILKTNDGFNTCTVHNTDTSFIVQAISLLNDSTGFYLNNATRLRKFEHYGSSFSHVIDTLFDGQNMEFVNSHTGYLDNGNRLMMTSDAGVNWNYINNNLGFFCVVFKFADSLNGYFSDFNFIYKTNDGGITFPQQYNFPSASCFATNGNFCMAANNTGNVAYTTNGGLTWQTETTGINFINPESYTLKNTPGGYCFLFSEFCREIRKRQPVIAGISHPPSNNSNISIYPNPASIQITLYSERILEDAILTIYNSLGQKVKQIKTISGQTVTLDRNDLPSGLYFVRLIQDDKAFLTDKLIIVD